MISKEEVYRSYIPCDTMESIGTYFRLFANLVSKGVPVPARIILKEVDNMLIQAKNMYVVYGERRKTND